MIRSLGRVGVSLGRLGTIRRGGERLVCLGRKGRRKKDIFVGRGGKKKRGKAIENNHHGLASRTKKRKGKDYSKPVPAQGKNGRKKEKKREKRNDST